MQLLAVTVDDPGELAEGIAARIKKCGSVTETSEEDRSTAVLGRVVRSLDKMLTKRGLPADTRATVAAIASNIPQDVFSTIVTGTNMGRSTNKGKFTNRNGVVRAVQGGQKPRSERVGLGVVARKTAILDRVRLEAGCNVVRPRYGRFKASVVAGAVAWLADNADISSNWKRRIRHNGTRVNIPSMLLRQRPSELYRRYASSVATPIGESVFRAIIDEAFSVTRGRRTAMDYLGLTLGERNFAAMHTFVDNTAPAEARDELHGIIDGAST